MKIASVRSFPLREPVCTALVRVTSEDGTIGWGESDAPLAPEVVCTIVDRLLASVLCGREFDGSKSGIERLWAGMYSKMRVHGQTGGFMMDAIAGVDIALWDLAGKLVSKSVSDLLGAAKSHVPAYWSGPNPPAQFRVVKLIHNGSEEDLLGSIDSLRGQFDVAVDGQWRFEPDSAAAFGRQLDARNVVWFGNPLPPEDPRAHAAIARRFRTPIALGESYRTHFELAPFFREGAMKVVQPDVGRTGITEGLRIAAEAAKYGVAVIPSVGPSMGPKTAAAIHFAAAAGCNLLEYAPAIQVQNARYPVSGSPGLGLSESDLF